MTRLALLAVVVSPEAASGARRSSAGAGDIVPAGCHGTGLDATSSLIGRRR